MSSGISSPKASATKANTCLSKDPQVAMETYYIVFAPTSRFSPRPPPLPHTYHKHTWMRWMRLTFSICVGPEAIAKPRNVPGREAATREHFGKYCRFENVLLRGATAEPLCYNTIRHTKQHLNNGTDACQLECERVRRPGDPTERSTKKDVVHTRKSSETFGLCCL